MTTTTYPLLLNYRQLTACNGFWASINLKEVRLLLEHDPDAVDKFWVYGPIGISTWGSDQDSALSSFASRLRDIIRDEAEEAKTFEDFKTSANTSFGGINDGYNAYNALWESAVENGLALTGYPDTRKYSPSVSIERIDSPHPTLNYATTQSIYHVHNNYITIVSSTLHEYYRDVAV